MCNEPNRPKLTVDLATFVQTDSLWKDFQEVHGDWIGRVVDDTGVIYALPKDQLHSALRLYRTTEEDREAELDFSNICDRSHVIAFASGRPVPYMLLDQSFPLQAEVDAEWLRNHGWNNDHIATVKSGDDPTRDIRDRMRASVGRLLARPDYIAAVKEVKSAWQAIPAGRRPSLPLWPQSQLLEEMPNSSKIAEDPVNDFWNQFIDFCDFWQLQGLATWQLPLPQGPIRLPDFGAPDGSAALTLSHPWHYPLQGQEGVGELALAEHQIVATERGVDDHGSWQTYSSFLPIAHWEHVLRSRYKNAQAVGLVTAMEVVLGEITHLSTDRVQRLRTRLGSLQSGSISSLKGKR